MAETLKLFLVEDDDDFSYLMRKSLERAGHHVTVCHSGADALIVLSHTSFQLVLLDQKLPDMSGLDLLQALHRESIATPVLMVTGYGDEQLAAQVLRAGALDYIVKDRALTFLTDLPKRVHESITRYRLQQSNNLLIAALESARDGIMITDLQGTIQHVNQALEKMFGYDRAALIGQNPRIFRSGVHAYEFFTDLWQTVMNRASWQGELVNKRKDGTLLDSSLTVSPIMNGQGQLTHFVGIFRDVSEHKQMERQLFQAQKMQSVGTLAGGVAHEFNNLLAGIQGYASLSLRDGTLQTSVRQFLEYIVQLSDRAANLTRQLLAFARKPALSRQATSMEHLLTTTVTLVRHTLKMDVRLDIQGKDEGGRGKEAWIKVEAGFRPGREMILAKESTTLGRSESSDISLLGDAAVENTHCWIVQKGNNYVLEDNNTPGGTYVNDIKVDKRAPLSSGDLIKMGGSLLRFYERRKEEPADGLSHPSSPILHPSELMALADANQLQQVLVNLALNARDASPHSAEGFVEFRLRHMFFTSEQPAFPQNVPPGDYAVLEVEDHGTGMSQQVLQQALDPFFTTKDVGQGTGLGLPVAFGIILGHQGFLTIDTRVNQGTCVRLYLPRLGRISPPPSAGKTFEMPEVLELETQPNRNILVIDDEEAVTDIIRRFLEIAGHQVTCVASTAQGVEILKQNGSMDLVILDLMIPKEEGLQNIQKLRQCAPSLPILLCTGLLKTDEAGQLLEQGNIDILRKPFRMNELWYAVNKALSPR